jgi:vitamin K-dependent gamma-carboxylase
MGTERDAAGLAVFRALFGALMLMSVVRFVARGWVRELYLEPAFHFTYWGFDWVKPWPGWGMYVHFALMGLGALGICLGAFTRLSALIFFLTFTYAELIDKTAYLNHYYLVSLLSLLLVFVPAGAAFSIDARRRPRSAYVGGWSYILLRVQVGLVYVYAGLAKLNHDWLFRAEPLRSWLAHHADLPLVGPLFAGAVLPYVMSWAGALFDLSIVPLLVWPKTRRFAYAFAVVFHVAIWLLFPVGVFSWVMLVAATVFFDPSWPRRWLAPAPAPAASASPPPRWCLALAAVYLFVQLALPLRHIAYPDTVNWTEQGFRFAWRVMLIEKTGLVEFEVHAGERRFVVRPRDELTPLQYKMMSTQPDMIHDYALHLAERYAARGEGQVRVYAKAWASLNGRPSQLLIDPKVDLAAEPRRLGHSRFIVPLSSYWTQISSGSVQMPISGLQQTYPSSQVVSPHGPPGHS